ncbi:site-specific recombinase XerC [Geodermatophilus tzadiensis]|uniref:Site-specific recombinase XerC n=1 Tax=Geodermatophilus tzadiensis TaxID=1137988 RepID=A0A2T0U0E4_9ACTN|nr:site-specific integrase [Geodermatophilus tzadiensis]PRY51385.1 site-specific recombinase XerC [Geodermatophilus tzadiensis]
MPKRTFGSVDRLPSGRFRARYLGPDGRRHSKIFAAKADAWAWLASEQTDLARKSWRAPNASGRTVGEYAEDYLARNDLRESTRVLYAGLWRHHLAEAWAHVPVDEVTPAAVRSWHAQAGRTTRPTALAQSYRLLRAVLNVAVADEAIPSNPCRLRGAGTPKASRPSRALTAAEALQLAERLGQDRRTERYRALLLVLAFGGLRFGEATALRRSDVLTGGRLRVERSVRRVSGRWVVGEPKTDAGHRTVTLPAAIAAVLEEHVRKYVGAAPDALLFSTSTGGYLARSNWNSTFRRAANAIGLPAVRPHELRHTGATLAAGTGATTKELMRRLGHSSPAAALLYQHAADDRDADIARALDAMLGALGDDQDGSEPPK